MDVFKWDKNFETGIAQVDQQHHQLIDITNAFGEQLAQGDIHEESINKLLKRLIDYTVEHFSTEEKLMQQTGIDDKHLSRHQQEHQSFLEEVTLLEQSYNRQEKETGRHLFEFLANWLAFHILGTDMNMSRQMKFRSAGYSEEDAFSVGEENLDRSTSMLLTSLNNLFTQVSRRNKELSELNRTLEEKVAERTRELQQLALTDPLTGLHNRRHAMQLLNQLWTESQTEERQLACIMIDADGFKQINDSYGHDAGDVVLKELATQLSHAVRTDDVVCRLGGDEFLIICPATDMAGALHLAELTHTKIAQLRVKARQGVWQGSISVGVGVKTSSMTQTEELIKAADESVYAAKSAGRNCVRCLQQNV